MIIIIINVSISLFINTKYNNIVNKRKFNKSNNLFNI